MENQFSVERARLKLISIILSYLMLLSLSFFLSTRRANTGKRFTTNKQGLNIIAPLLASKASLCAKAKGR